MFNMLKKREMETLYKEPDTILKNDQSNWKKETNKTSKMKNTIT